jgi:uncharacterized membrane protein YkvI
MSPALALMAIYIVVTAILQFAGFLVSRVVESVYPALGLMTFLVLYLGMFWLAWPIAVRITESYVPGAKSTS